MMKQVYQAADAWELQFLDRLIILFQIENDEVYSYS